MSGIRILQVILAYIAVICAWVLICAAASWAEVPTWLYFGFSIPGLMASLFSITLLLVKWWLAESKEAKEE